MVDRNTIWILMGFKSVGKSTIGKELAQWLDCPWIDLDERVEARYFDKLKRRRTVRQIVHWHGDDFFQTMSHAALKQALSPRKYAYQARVLSLGGGTPMYAANQDLLKNTKGHFLIYLRASKKMVFERMMAQGLPAFLKESEHPEEAFEHLWELRTAVYQRLAMKTVDCVGGVSETVEEMIQGDV